MGMNMSLRLIFKILLAHELNTQTLMKTRWCSDV